MEGHKICKYANHVPKLLASCTNTSVFLLQTACYVKKKKKLNSHLFLIIFLFVLWKFHLFIHHILIHPPPPPSTRPLTCPSTPLTVAAINISEQQCGGYFVWFDFSSF